MNFKYKGCLLGIIVLIVFSGIGAMADNFPFFIFFSLLGWIFLFAISFERKKRVKCSGKPIDINLSAPKRNTIDKAQLILKNTDANDSGSLKLACNKIATLIVQQKMRCTQLEEFLKKNQPIYENTLQKLSKKFETDNPDIYIKLEALKPIKFTPAGNILLLFDHYKEFQEFDFSIFDDFDFQPFGKLNSSYFDELYERKNITSATEKELIEFIYLYALEYAAIIIKTYDTLRFNTLYIEKIKSIGNIDHLDTWIVEPCDCSCCQNADLAPPFEKTPALPRHIGCTCRLSV